MLLQAKKIAKGIGSKNNQSISKFKGSTEIHHSSDKTIPFKNATDASAYAVISEQSTLCISNSPLHEISPSLALTLHGGENIQKIACSLWEESERER